MSVNGATNKAQVIYNTALVSLSDIAESVSKAGYTAVIEGLKDEEDDEEPSANSEKKVIIPVSGMT